MSVPTNFTLKADGSCAWDSLRYEETPKFLKASTRLHLNPQCLDRAGHLGLEGSEVDRDGNVLLADIPVEVTADLCQAP